MGTLYLSRRDECREKRLNLRSHASVEEDAVSIDGDLVKVVHTRDLIAMVPELPAERTEH